MSTLEDLDDQELERKEEKKDGEGDDGKDGKTPQRNGDAEMKDAEERQEDEDEVEENQIDDEILNSNTREILARKRLLENDTRIMRSEYQRLTHEKATMNEKIKDNHEKIQNNRY